MGHVVCTVRCFASRLELLSLRCDPLKKTKNPKPKKPSIWVKLLYIFTLNEQDSKASGRRKGHEQNRVLSISLLVWCWRWSAGSCTSAGLSHSPAPGAWRMLMWLVLWCRVDFTDLRGEDPGHWSLMWCFRAVLPGVVNKSPYRSSVEIILCESMCVTKPQIIQILFCILIRKLSSFFVLHTWVELTRLY